MFCPLWVGSVDGFPSLYEGLLAEMDAPWECVDIDFFIPVHPLMYRVPYQSVRDILFAAFWCSWGTVSRISSDWATESEAILISRHCCTVFFLFVFQERKKKWSEKCCQSQFRNEVLTYCSSHDEDQCDYPERCLRANRKGCCSLLHLLSLTRSQMLVFKMSIDSLKGKDTHKMLHLEPEGSFLFRLWKVWSAWDFVIIIKLSQSCHRSLMISHAVLWIRRLQDVKTSDVFRGIFCSLLSQHY